MAKKRTGSFSLGPNFEEKFIKDMVSKPDISIIELVSNAWDAGATEVHITWPIVKEILDGEIFKIIDNGQGMTEDEFYKYWQELGVDKRKNLGHIVTLEDGTERPIYGRHGKGRLGLFAFSNSYTVQTCKECIKTEIRVKKTESSGYADFITTKSEQIDSTVKGTCIKCALYDNYIDLDSVKNILSTRFGADPKFKIFINGDELKLIDLEKYARNTYKFEDELIEIIQIPRDTYNKKLTQYQVVWWVNKKGIETNTWRELEIPLNAKNNIENKFVFNIIVDFLENHVTPEGVGFDNSDKVKRVKEFVSKKITELSSDYRDTSDKKKKTDVFELSKKDLKTLNPVSRKDIGQFVDRAIKQTSITSDQLAKLVSILTTMDRSVHRFMLLDKLSKLTAAQMDKLDEILDKWTVDEIYIVLDELYWRMELIKKLKLLVDDPTTKELEQLQPLFENGLWLFGPEYEGSTNFSSNKTLKTILKEVLKIKNVPKIEGEGLRPDFVATPDESLMGIYGSDKLNNGRVIGYREILVIELKKGASTIGSDEMNQATDYVRKIMAHGKIQKYTEVNCYVLGTKIHHEIRDQSIGVGNLGHVYPCTFDTIIRNGELRTLDLIKKLEKAEGISVGDPEINEVMREEDAQTHLP